MDVFLLLILIGSPQASQTLPPSIPSQATVNPTASALSQGVELLQRGLEAAQAAVEHAGDLDGLAAEAVLEADDRGHLTKARQVGREAVGFSSAKLITSTPWAR